MVLNPSLRLGILNATPVSCHNLEAPELVESTEFNIPHPTVDTTMQLPFGFSSALSDTCPLKYILTVHEIGRSQRPISLTHKSIPKYTTFVKHKYRHRLSL